MHSPLVIKAIEFAGHIHRNQKRKFSDSPYIVHPLHVAGIVSSYTQEEDVIAAAILHDVIEDSEPNEKVTKNDLVGIFNENVASIVADVSVQGPDTLDTKKKSREHILSAGWESQMVKIADIMSNTLWNIVRLEKYTRKEVEYELGEDLQEILTINTEFIGKVSDKKVLSTGIIEKTQKCLEELSKKL